MTKRGQKFGKVLFVSMLLTLTIALGGCAGDKEEEGEDFCLHFVYKLADLCCTDRSFMACSQYTCFYLGTVICLSVIIFLNDN